MPASGPSDDGCHEVREVLTRPKDSGNIAMDAMKAAIAVVLRIREFEIRTETLVSLRPVFQVLTSGLFERVTCKTSDSDRSAADEDRVPSIVTQSREGKVPESLSEMGCRLMRDKTSLGLSGQKKYIQRRLFFSRSPHLPGRGNAGLVVTSAGLSLE